MIILARYFVVAGGCWWLVHRWRPRPAAALSELQGQRIRDGIRHDIRLSVLSAHGCTRLYTGADPNTWCYLGVSYALVLILQDALFYATHRLFHQPALYAAFHRGHHRSRQPTPWTSFAFDPPEALVQALFLVGIVMLIPLHLITLLAVLSTMTVWAIVNHLDLDCLPARFPHHRRPAVHFGLYFTLWDRVFDTQDANYARGLNVPAV